ncbi:hypothetical protein BS47DRAFT_742198 [Hydnum rufescens UP504]|uniref:Uncharacterized protein n=1 Tax=Hydnum rufescens UP504 TaxID=1448309 RepID=A0A9P6DY94_9AGAM|nr:hypothetical protein BS47DRAFT_742198 [Hydnum rufescens UP504]
MVYGCGDFTPKHMETIGVDVCKAFQHERRQNHNHTINETLHKFFAIKPNLMLETESQLPISRRQIHIGLHRAFSCLDVDYGRLDDSGSSRHSGYEAKEARHKAYDQSENSFVCSVRSATDTIGTLFDENETAQAMRVLRIGPEPIF